MKQTRNQNINLKQIPKQKQTMITTIIINFYKCSYKSIVFSLNLFLNWNIFLHCFSSFCREFQTFTPTTEVHICFAVVLTVWYLKCPFLLPSFSIRTNKCWRSVGNTLFFALNITISVRNSTNSLNFNNLEPKNKAFVCSIILQGIIPVKPLDYCNQAGHRSKIA